MSDPKRATLITVGAPKSAKNKVTKTVRLTINLDESNESKYPELNYKELVITEERKKRVENGKTGGLDPFSDNDDDVERVARKFEQKYGGKSTYGRRGRKRDDFADIGAGYDENDSFIDNTHGYDEMIPPECDTLYGGFYINSGSLEFKTVPDGQNGNSDEPAANRKKRCISSSSSEDESSESSSESESAEEKEPKAIANGTLDSHETEHRKKKNKKIDKKKADKIRRTDSSAATSGKQTSDDNGPADAESADSRTSQSDSLTSKPAPSSENAITSDSSRDVESKVEVKLPQAVSQVLEELEALVRLLQSVNSSSEDVELKADPYIIKLERSLTECGAGSRVQRGAWGRAARLLRLGRHRLQRRAADLARDNATPTTTIAQTTVNSVTTATTITTVNTTTTNTTTTTTTSNTTTNPTTSNTTTNPTTSNTTTNTTSNKRKYEEDTDIMDISRLTADEKEAKIVETLQRLKTLIEERRPGMIANYNAECERVQEERKKIQIASRSEGAPMIEKRLPKRRFPWCGRSRALLARLARLAGAAPADLLARRALPLFPKGFVRMPTLLRQADLSKEMKAAETKRQRTNEPVSQTIPYTEQIQFPSSLTVTTSVKTSDKQEPEDKDSKYKINPAVFGKIINYSISNDLIVEKADDKKKENDKIKEDYIPTNNIGCITITPVPNQKPLKKNNIITDKKEPLIKVISPAALNEMVKKDKHKKPEKKKNRVESPLHIDTGYQNKEATASPKKEEVTQKQLESMRTAENNLPRPALIPVHHSPTFAKPDKRPPEVKKKKDVMIMSDVDPLGDIVQEPVAIDDSSSDIEVVEDKNIDKSDKTVPLSDKVCSEVNSVKKDSKECQQNYLEESTNEDMDNLMRNIIAMEHSQEPAKLNCNSYGGVITSAKHESNKQYNARNTIFGGQHSDKNKFAGLTSLNKMDGCSVITG